MAGSGLNDKQLGTAGKTDKKKGGPKPACQREQTQSLSSAT